ncbi:MAG: acyl transferase [Agriterribacter sp.]
MKNCSSHNDITQGLFDFNISDFEGKALELFRFQYDNNTIYRSYCNALGKNRDTIHSLTDIPFLPIRFFKTHEVKTTSFTAAAIFESSGTTQTVNSRHHVKDSTLYTQSFSQAFELFYGKPEEWCILALLPSYLERNHSSLVVMADALIQQSGHASGGFYLYDHGRLATVLAELEAKQQKTLLLGVTFGLLDFAEKHAMPLRNTVIMETGGMKGRRDEMTREEMHAALRNAFEVEQIHSEYGMTELLSQAYSQKNGVFYCPPWMKILLREEDDPLAIPDYHTNKTVNGIINVVDLANVYSCSFIATEDAGRLHPDGGFEVLGRVDNSDIRGCSLMAV